MSAYLFLSFLVSLSQEPRLAENTTLTGQNIVQVEGEEGVEHDVDTEHDDAAAERNPGTIVPDVIAVKADLIVVKVHRLRKSIKS